MHTRLLTLIVIAAALPACATRGPLPPGAPPSGESPSGTAQPEPPIPGQAVPAPPEQPAPGAPRQSHLGAAASALVTQARTQAGGGEHGPGGPRRRAPPPAGGPPPGAAHPGPPIPGQAVPAPPEQPAPGAPRQSHLGAAASALVTQARTQAGGGEYGQAAATLERALRIEPGNPLLWIELRRVRLSENNAAQAEAMGRKALALPTGDAGAQAAAWHLIADSLHSRGRDPEAAEAEGRAGALAPRRTPRPRGIPRRPRPPGTGLR